MLFHLISFFFSFLFDQFARTKIAVYNKRNSEEEEDTDEEADQKDEIPHDTDNSEYGVYFFLIKNFSSQNLHFKVVH